MHYLVRLDPYTEQARLLQGGRFDVPDRLFYSIEAAWLSGQGTSGDVKEMVPELFYMPDILENKNQEAFGIRQDQVSVNDVELPRWAKTPLDFIRKHRQALESNYVSQNLNNWVDLVFGFKQRGKPAEAALNTFCSITYEDYYNMLLKTENLDSIEGYVEQIVHFGQTPIQLFKQQHVIKDQLPKQTTIFEKFKQNGLDSLDTRSLEIDGTIYTLIMTSKHLIGVKGSGNKLILLKISIKKDLEDLRADYSSYREYDLEGTKNMRLEDWEEAVQ